MRTKLLAAGILLTLAAPAAAENWDFVLVNKTGKTVTLVEVAAAGTGEWSKEKVEVDINSDIAPGKDHTVHFERDPKVCKFDVRLTFADDSTGTAGGLNVCDHAFAEFGLKAETLTMKGT